MDTPGNSTIGLVKKTRGARTGAYREVQMSETVIVVDGCYAEIERTYETQQEVAVARETMWAMLPVTPDTSAITADDQLQYPYPPADPDNPVNYNVRAPGGAVQVNLDDEPVEVWVHSERRI